MFPGKAYYYIDLVFILLFYFFTYLYLYLVIYLFVYSSRLVLGNILKSLFRYLTYTILLVLLNPSNQSYFLVITEQIGNNRIIVAYIAVCVYDKPATSSKEFYF